MAARHVKAARISGFPEWLPAERLAEQSLLDTIRRQYELFGFTPIETPAVERMTVLSAKGGVQNQIFVLGRNNADEEKEISEDATTTAIPDELGLHFDLTVPLARYVVQHANDLAFPFRRYQMQKVWRGERPQRGRFHEFYQCDIDVIGSGSLDLIHDAEIPAIINSVFDALGVGEFAIHISNRRILTELLAAQGLSAEVTGKALKVIDGADGDDDEALGPLRDGLGALHVDPIPITSLLACESIDAARAVLKGAGATEAGLDELQMVVTNALELGTPANRLKIDFSIVRGLDYYTGTVYETFVEGQSWPSVCSGGRYDDLASLFSERKLPGVGISIGASRLFDLMNQAGFLSTEQKTVTQVLVTMQNREKHLKSYLALGRHLRNSGIRSEVYLEPDVLRDQLGYATAKGIPIAVIAGDRELDADSVTVRDLRHNSEEHVTGDGLVEHIRRLLE